MRREERRSHRRARGGGAALSGAGTRPRGGRQLEKATWPRRSRRQVHRGCRRSALRRLPGGAGRRSNAGRDDREEEEVTEVSRATEEGRPYTERAARFEQLAADIGRTSRLVSNFRGLSFGIAVIALVMATLGGKPAGGP